MVEDDVGRSKNPAAITNTDEILDTGEPTADILGEIYFAVIARNL
jgi:hypothetical protein